MKFDTLYNYALNK